MPDLCLLTDGMYSYADGSMHCSFAAFRGKSPETGKLLHHMDRALLSWASRKYRPGSFTAEAAALFCGLAWLRHESLLTSVVHLHLYADSLALLDYVVNWSIGLNDYKASIVNNGMRMLPRLLGMAGDVHVHRFPSEKMKASIIGH